MSDKKGGEKKKPISRSSRAGLQFPVGRIHRLLKVRSRWRGDLCCLGFAGVELVPAAPSRVQFRVHTNGLHPAATFKSFRLDCGGFPSTDSTIDPDHGAGSRGRQRTSRVDRSSLHSCHLG